MKVGCCFFLRISWIFMVFYGILTRTAGENLIELWFEG